MFFKKLLLNLNYKKLSQYQLSEQLEICEKCEFCYTCKLNIKLRFKYVKNHWKNIYSNYCDKV